MELQELHSLFKASSGVCTDTRKIIGGELFFALKGPNFNANKLATRAIEAGAAFVIVDEVHQPNDRLIVVPDVLKCLQELATYHRLQFHIPIIAITGTNGKTTNKELIKEVLSKKYKVLATAGNYNNHIGVPLTLLSINEDHEIAVVEMGANHKGDIQELCAIAQPNFGLITSIGIAHLEGFGSLEVIKATKKELYDYIVQHNGICFVNHNAASVPALFSGTNKQTIYYGREDDNIVLLRIDATERFLKVNLKIGKDRYSISTHLLGTFHANNVLNAVAVGNYFNVDEDAIVDALENYEPKNNRSQIVKYGSNTILLDAYNANPTSMSAAIESFAEGEVEHKMLILGDMLELGPKSTFYHQEVVEQLVPFNFYQVVLVGEEFMETKTPKNFVKFETTEAAKKWWKKQHLEHKEILLKGSRGIGLEKIIQED
jgi:UDP-N-acetylmuramoyl-tripeptide--D-alanyl-D-alanine ligase